MHDLFNADAYEPNIGLPITGCVVGIEPLASPKEGRHVSFKQLSFTYAEITRTHITPRDNSAF
jgi:hypothetical protein